MGKIVALFGLTLLLYVANSSAEMSSDTKDQITSGMSEFKNVVDSIETLTSDKKLLSKIQQLSGYLGVAGGLISFALLFVPASDSEELKYMKQKFSEVNTKLDRITSEFDTVKDMITLENQRSVYIGDAAKINYAYKQLTQNYLTEMAAITSCSSSRDCLRKRLRVAESYQSTFNVKANVAKILTGTTTSTSVFGDPLLDLVKNTYKCDVSKVTLFANGVLKLVFKGQQVVLAHEKLTGTNTSITLAMKDWSNMVYALRAKVDSVKKYCYDNIQTFMTADIKDTKYQTNMASNDAAAKSMKRSLNNKYPWLHWTIISYGAWGGNTHWGFSKFSNMPSDKNARKRVMRVSPQDKGTYRNQRYAFSQAVSRIVADVKFSSMKAKVVYNEMKKELMKTTVWNTLSSFIVLYDDYTDFKHSVDSTRGLHWYNEQIQVCYNISTSQSSVSSRCRRWFKVRIVATFYSEEQIAGSPCSKSCNGKGTCSIPPFSSSAYCICERNYQGDNCENYDKINLASNVDLMLSATTQIPKLTDVYYELLDMQDYLGASIGNVQNSIAALDSKLESKFNDLNSKITNEFQWANLITHYSDTMRDLKFYLHRFQLLNTTKSTYATESKALAGAITQSGKVRKWLFELHHLIVGRNDVSVLTHKPLLFLIMEKNKARACETPYKAALDNSWRQIIVLQNQAYMMWAQANYILNQPTDEVLSLYIARTADQVTFMQTSTCQIVVSKSVNLQCSGGFYLHPAITLVNKCEQNYYIAGRTSTTCVSRSSTCEHCACNSDGSSSSECRDLAGQCSCRNYYYGKRCSDRDCKWTPYGRYGSCSKSCDYGGTQRKTRSHAVTQRGNGRSCSGSSSHSQSCFNGCCSGSFHCSTNRKCIPASKRCNYDNDCGNSQDEQSCKEACTTKYTSWNDDGDGDAVYLDRHRLNCGSSSYALKMFRLERNGDRMRYRYICCKFLVSIGSYRQVINGYSYDGDGDTVYLDRQTITCGSNGIINDYYLSRNSRRDHWRYIYYCISVKSHYVPKLSCYSTTTSYTYDGNGRNYYLDRQHVSCHDRYFLTYIKLQRHSNHSHWRYSIRCCRLKTT